MNRYESTGFKIIVLQHRINWFLTEINMQQNQEIANKLSQKMIALQLELQHLLYNVSWQYA